MTTILDNADLMPRLSATWNGPHPVLGGHHFWIDGTGALRKKSTAPTTDLDGTVLGAATVAPTSKFVGLPPAAATVAYVWQSANRAYYMGVDAIDQALTVTKAFIDFSTIVAGNFNAMLYRQDTGALLAQTGVTAIPAVAGVASFTLLASALVPAGVELATCMAASPAATLAVRGPGGAGQLWYGTTGLRFGAMDTLGSLAAPTAPLPANGSLQRAPGVIFA